MRPPQSYGYELRLPLAVSIVPVHSTRLLGESFWVLLYLGSPQPLNRTAAAKKGRRGSRPRQKDNDAAADRLRRRRIDALSYSVNDEGSFSCVAGGPRCPCLACSLRYVACYRFKFKVIIYAAGTLGMTSSRSVLHSPFWIDLERTNHVIPDVVTAMPTSIVGFSVYIIRHLEVYRNRNNNGRGPSY